MTQLFGQVITLSGSSQASYIQRENKESERIYQCGLLIFEYEDDREDKGNKISLDTILCTERSDQGMEG